MLGERDHPGRTPQADKPEAPRPTTATRVLTPPVDGKTPPRPFYRTRRGIIIIIMAFVAIVAVVVGIGVGVSQGVRSVSTVTPAPSKTQPNGTDPSSSDTQPQVPQTTPIPSQNSLSGGGGGVMSNPTPTLPSLPGVLSTTRGQDEEPSPA